MSPESVIHLNIGVRSSLYMVNEAVQGSFSGFYTVFSTVLRFCGSDSQGFWGKLSWLQGS